MRKHPNEQMTGVQGWLETGPGLPRGSATGQQARWLRSEYWLVSSAQHPRILLLPCDEVPEPPMACSSLLQRHLQFLFSLITLASFPFVETYLLLPTSGPLPMQCFCQALCPNLIV